MSASLSATGAENRLDPVCFMARVFSVRTLFFAGLAGLLLAGGAFAQDAAPDAKPKKPLFNLKIDGKEYEAVELMSTTGEVVTFESKQGPVNVKWRDLSPEIQHRYAQDYEKAQQELQDAVLKTAITVKVSGKVLKKLPGGLLVTWGEQTVLLNGYPFEEKIKEGDEVSAIAQRAGIFQYAGPKGAQTVRKYRAIPPMKEAAGG